jgi:hypothetical protein
VLCSMVHNSLFWPHDKINEFMLENPPDFLSYSTPHTLRSFLLYSEHRIAPPLCLFLSHTTHTHVTTLLYLCVSKDTGDQWG